MCIWYLLHWAYITSEWNYCIVCCHDDFVNMAANAYSWQDLDHVHIIVSPNKPHLWSGIWIAVDLVPRRTVVSYSKNLSQSHCLTQAGQEPALTLWLNLWDLITCPWDRETAQKSVSLTVNPCCGPGLTWGRSDSKSACERGRYIW